MLKVRAVSRLCEFHLGIRLTTEEKARKTLIYLFFLKGHLLVKQFFT
jgi:hypothetical protein